MSLAEIKQKLLRDKNYENTTSSLELFVSDLVRAERCQQGITQSELAKKMQTKQSSISRLESGSYSPTISFLNRLAKALNRELLPPRFAEPVDLEYKGGISWPVNQEAKMKKNSDLTLIFNN